VTSLPDPDEDDPRAEYWALLDEILSGSAFPALGCFTLVIEIRSSKASEAAGGDDSLPTTSTDGDDKSVNPTVESTSAEDDNEKLILACEEAVGKFLPLLKESGRLQIR
jgi:hypothetical protein